jgi:hypothetical protein
MSLADAVFGAMRDWLQRKGIDVTEVLGYQESTRSGGYCETCYYTYIVVEIDYRKADKTVGCYVYDGEFSDLIRALDY